MLSVFVEFNETFALVEYTGAATPAPTPNIRTVNEFFALVEYVWPSGPEANETFALVEYLTATTRRQTNELHALVEYTGSAAPGSTPNIRTLNELHALVEYTQPVRMAYSELYALVEYIGLPLLPSRPVLQWQLHWQESRDGGAVGEGPEA